MKSLRLEDMPGRPLMEGLEPRLLLSGNVTLLVSLGNLTITGDASDNYIQFSQTDLTVGNFTVTGQDGTTVTISGGSAAGARSVTGVTGNITFNFVQGGNDTVELTSDVHVGNVNRTTLLGKRGSVTYNGGVGDDIVTLGGHWATGTVTFTGQPADGDTLTLGDPDGNEVVFEFNSGGGVTGNNTAVAIGATSTDTLANLIASVRDSNLMLRIDDISAGGTVEARILMPPGTAGNGLIEWDSTALDVVNTAGGSDFVFDSAGLTVALGGSTDPETGGGNMLSVGSIPTSPSFEMMSEIHGNISVTGGVAALNGLPVTMDVAFIANAAISGTSTFNFSTGVTDASVILYNNGPGAVGGNVTYSGGAGDDFLGVNSTVFGNLSATFGAGNNDLNAVDSTIAGNLTASATAGDNIFDLAGISVYGTISVTAGAGNDEVDLTDGGSQGATTVNLGAGTNSTDLTSGWYSGNVSVSGGAGDDAVYLADGLTIYGNLTLALGDGVNSASVANAGSGDLDPVTVKGAVSITNAGAAVATVELAGQMGATTVTLGSGGSTVTLDNARITGALNVTSTGGVGTYTLAENSDVEISGLAKIATGNAADQITLGANSGGTVRVGSTLTISTGNGSDVVDIRNNWEVGGAFSLTLGAPALGGDTVNLFDGAIAGNASITTGSGGDTIKFDGMTVLGNVVMSTGSGNDQVYLPDLTAYGSLTLNLGDGNNLATVIPFGGSSLTQAHVGGAVIISNTGAGSSEVELAGTMGATTISFGLGATNDLVLDNAHINGAMTITSAGGLGTFSLAPNNNVDVVGAAKITTGNDNDDIAIGSGSSTLHVGSTLTIATGNGDDTVDIRNNWRVGSSFSLTMGNAATADTISLADGRIVGGATITTGTAGDEIDLDGMTILGNTSVTTGAGNDHVYLPNLVNFGSLTLAMGDGSNLATVAPSLSDPMTYAHIGGAVTISNTGTGSDRVDLSGSMGSTTISLGSGSANAVTIDDTHIAGNLTITGGSAVVGGLTVTAGSGTFTVAENADVAISGAAKITAGIGNDTILLGNNSGGTVSIGSTLTIATGNSVTQDVFALVNNWEVGGAFSLTMGNAAPGTGNSITLADGLFGAGATISTGTAGDEVVLDGMTITGNTSITTGAGDDHVYLPDLVNYGSLTVAMGDGSNTATTAPSLSDPLTFAHIGGAVNVTNTGTGSSRVDLTGAMGSTTITLGSGLTNVVNLDDAHITGSLTIAGSSSLVNGSGTFTLAETDDVIISGTAKITTGNGNDTIKLGAVSGGAVNIGSTLTIATGNSTTADEVDIVNNWLVVGAFSLTLGNADLNTGNTINLKQGRIGGAATITTGTASDGVTLADMTIVGNATVTAGAGNDDLYIPDLVVYGNLSASMGAGNNTVSVYNNASPFNFTEAYVGGTVTISSPGVGIGTGDTTVEWGGRSGAVTMTLGSGENNVTVDNAWIFGNLAISAQGNNFIDLATTDLGAVNTVEVSGSLTVTTGAGNDSLVVGSEYGPDVDHLYRGELTVGQSLGVGLGAGSDSVDMDYGWNVLGNATVSLSGNTSPNPIGLVDGRIGGSLTVTTGAGSEQLTLTDLMVFAGTTINTGAGSDSVDVNGVSDFCMKSGTFSLATGDGTDTVNIANKKDSAEPVIFYRAVSIDMGLGDGDELNIGLSPEVGGTGDANTYAFFFEATTAPTFNGGLGINDTVHLYYEGGDTDLTLNNRLRLAPTVTGFETVDPTP
jgi:large repetitive protein